MKEITHLFAKIHTNRFLVNMKKAHFMIKFTDYLTHFSQSSGGQQEKNSNRSKLITKKIPYWAKLRAFNPFWLNSTSSELRWAENGNLWIKILSLFGIIQSLRKRDTKTYLEKLPTFWWKMAKTVPFSAKLRVHNLFCPFTWSKNPALIF